MIQKKKLDLQLRPNISRARFSLPSSDASRSWLIESVNERGIPTLGTNSRCILIFVGMGDLTSA